MGLPGLYTRGTWRGLETGVEDVLDPTEADGTTGGDSPLNLEQPIRTGVPFAPGLPWYDAAENPFAETGLFRSPEPTYPNEDVGAKPIVGAYEAAFMSTGPVQQWGHEPSGGAFGDQALGRFMRFPTNIPQRFSANGVQDNNYADELAAAIANGNFKQPSSARVTESLLMGI